MVAKTVSRSVVREAMRLESIKENDLILHSKAWVKTYLLMGSNMFKTNITIHLNYLYVKLACRGNILFCDYQLVILKRRYKKDPVLQVLYNLIFSEIVGLDIIRKHTEAERVTIFFQLMRTTSIHSNYISFFLSGSLF